MIKSKEKIKRKIGAIVVLGIFTALMLAQPATAVDITMNDDDWIGLGGGAGRIVFDSTPTPDEIEMLDAYVGIGTDDPGYILTVQEDKSDAIYGDGQIRIQGDTDTGQFLSFHLGTTSEIATIQAGDSSGGYEYFPLLLNPSGGNVGVQIAVTNSEFHVGGTTPQITIGDAEEEDTSLLFDGNAQDFYMALEDTTDNLLIGTGSIIGSSEKMVIENGGDVGIGTTNPNTKLEILDTSTQLRLAFDSTHYTDFQIQSDHDLLINPTNTGQVLFQPTVDSTGFFQVLDQDGVTPILNVDSTNDRLGIGTATPDNTLEILSTSTQLQLTNTDNTDYAKFAVDTNGQLDITSVGTSNEAHINLIPESGSFVGIGTTDPDSFVEIQSLNEPQLQITNTDDTDYATFKVDSDGALDIVTVDGGGAIGHISLRPDGNVGIGTLTPSYAKLQIVDTSTQLRLDYNTLNYASFDVSSAGVLTIQTFANGETTADMKLRTEGFDNAIYIDDSASGVGIGTVSPSAKLHSLATTEQLRLGYDTSNYASFTVTSNSILTIQTTATGGTTEDIELRTGGFDNAIYVDDSASRVGIGTSGPLSELTIGGGGDVAITFDVDQDWYVGVEDLVDDRFKIGFGSTVGTNDIITIMNNNWVGINADAPRGPLDVSSTTGGLIFKSISKKAFSINLV
jgi:hypothetical protein